MPAAQPSAQGTTFTFGGVSFAATKVSVKRSTGEIDVSTLDIADGGASAYEPATLNDGDVISVEGFGLPNPGQDAPAAIACAKFSITGYAICTDYEMSAEVKGKLKFTASFRITTVTPAA